ncbi:MAG: hypothetical protein IKL92_01080 [Oscillospiraceae bacterium]|nr:hypothetical protein [Oscillospiraceae bacterium]
MTKGEARELFLRYLGAATVNGAVKRDGDLYDAFDHLLSPAVIQVAAQFPQKRVETVTLYWQAPHDMAEITAAIEPLLIAHKNMPWRAQTVAVRLLLKHLDYCNALADIFVLKALGADVEAKKLYLEFLDNFGKYEIEIERYFDQYMFQHSIKRLVDKPATFYENS